jgi:hypothetical protein
MQGAGLIPLLLELCRGCMFVALWNRVGCCFFAHDELAFGGIFGKRVVNSCRKPVWLAGMQIIIVILISFLLIMIIMLRHTLFRFSLFNYSAMA